jgi:hypothetical protein
MLMLPWSLSGKHKADNPLAWPILPNRNHSPVFPITSSSNDNLFTEDKKSEMENGKENENY